MKLNGPRGVAMLFAAVLAIGRAVTYIQPNAPDFTAPLLREYEHLCPIWVWGVLWGITGIYLILQAFRPRQALALSFLAVMTTLWAGVYIHYAILRTVTEGPGYATGAWVTASVYLAIAGITVCLSKMGNIPAGRVEAVARLERGSG